MKPDSDPNTDDALLSPSASTSTSTSTSTSATSLSSASSSTTTSTTTSKTTTSPFQGKGYTNLVSEKTSSILFATDEWFACADNLIKDSDPVFVPDLYCPQGKVMDGWESRRRRTEGHDWCVIAIANANERMINDVVGIEIDTAYFTGNQTPRVSIEVANCYKEQTDNDNDNNNNDNNNNDKYIDDEEWMYTWMPGAIKRLLNGGGIQGTGQTPTQITNAQRACSKFIWNELLPCTTLQPGYDDTRMHYYVVDESMRERVKGFTHVRVNYFPDGGVARLRLWGSLLSINTNTNTKELLGCTTATANNDDDDDDDNDNVVLLPSTKPYHHPELSLSTNGGIGLKCSNKHYGIPTNLIRPWYGRDMGDGWETARHPDRPPILIKDPITNLIDNPLSDWAVLKLGLGGAIQGDGISRLIIDTKHFKGNFPESVMVEGCNANDYGNDNDNDNENRVASDDDVCAATPDKDDNDIKWFTLLTRTKMGPDREHVFEKEKGQLMNANQAVTHIRISIYPDGGISRVRVYGKPAITIESIKNS